MLYQSSLSGKKKMWKVEVDKNKIVVQHGFIDGKITTTETICEGKKHTTAEEQAQKEAKALYQKKLKSGYYEENDKNDKIYFPMLAHEFSEKTAYPCLIQPKLDGIRCIVYKKDTIVFQSRNNTIFQPFPEIAKELEPFFIENPDLILDGELYHHDLGFQKITSIVRKQDHPELNLLQYHIYDLICEEPYLIRYEIIRNIKGQYLFCVETKEATSRESIENYHTHYTKFGYEGIMIRNPYGLYQEKARSKDLLKYKHFKDAEFLVVGHTEGKHGIPVFTCVTGDKTFGVMMKTTTALKQEMLKNVADYYNKYLTVKYQELSDDGIPRFPVGIGFRCDHVL
jgi:ATP-dependent DNA ligase